MRHSERSATRSEPQKSTKSVIRIEWTRARARRLDACVLSESLVRSPSADRIGSECVPPSPPSPIDVTQ